MDRSQQRHRQCLLVCGCLMLLGLLWHTTAALGESANLMRAPKDVSRTYQLPPAPSEASLPALVFDRMLHFYQHVISQVDGARSNMYPTGSAYARQVFKKHGALLGIVLTTERLLHEGNEWQIAPRIRKYGVWRIHDPVQANDWWWHGPDWVYTPSSRHVRRR